MKKTATKSSKSLGPSRPRTPSLKQTSETLSSVKKDVNKSSITGRCISEPFPRASTPTHDKPAQADSPDVSHIVPTKISSIEPNNQAAQGKLSSRAVSKTAASSEEEISLTDQLDFEYTCYLQTMFRRKLAEAEASEVDDKLTVLQKRIAENQNILQKATERLKNIKFNKEVDALHKLQNPNYGRVLETLDNANCKEYLETMNKKLEQNQNRLRLKNIELPEGGAAELLEIINETAAACKNLKMNNNLELPKVMAELKASNNSTSETLSRCLAMVPEVEDLMVDRTILDICTRNE